jgi:hypothetical protein
MKSRMDARHRADRALAAIFQDSVCSRSNSGTPNDNIDSEPSISDAYCRQHERDAQLCSNKDTSNLKEDQLTKLLGEYGEPSRCSL